MTEVTITKSEDEYLLRVREGGISKTVIYCQSYEIEGCIIYTYSDKDCIKMDGIIYTEKIIDKTQ